MKALRLTFAILALGSTRLTAQGTGSQPNLILSLFAGVAAGHSLWSVGQQPLCVYGPEVGGVFTCSSINDTLQLSRTVTSSIVAGASATYFPSSHIGYQLELYYLGQSYDDTCSASQFDTTDVNQVNAQVCNSVTSSAPSSGAIGFFGGVVYRAAPTATISPYIRGGLGLISYSGGTIAMAGDFAENSQIFTRSIYFDENPKTTSFSAQFGVGITMRTSPGYQFRLELRDAIADLAYVTGPAPASGVPPTATKWFHNVLLTIGLDVVLEQKRGRRY
ncbi:MAG TPA: hypothetical protein VMH88_15335 [Gemmatimonadales bacterium]|nr:hypothetical protein [Gemmatimonadales bacterium]